MRIALLGAPKSGKTVYWSALFHAFQDEITIPPLTPKIKQQYREMNINKKVGFRIDITNKWLEKQLAYNSHMLDAQPITKWPDPTMDLDNLTADIKFDFVELDFDSSRSTYTNRVNSYTRTIEVDDPPGGLFNDTVHSIGHINRLRQADAAIVFLPMDAILKAITKTELDLEDIKQFNIDAALKGIKKVLEDVRAKNKYDDTFPCCFIISKSDECKAEDFPQVEDFLYNQDYGFINLISKEYPDMIICVCPTGILNPDTGNFQALNLEWPFLFAAAATIFRNHYDWMEKSEQDKRIARRYDNEAENSAKKAKKHSDKAQYYARKARELASRNLFARGWAFLARGESVRRYRQDELLFHRRANDHRSEADEKLETAKSYRNAAGRKINFANDDKQLAFDTWSSLSAEGAHRKIRIMVAGNMIEDFVDNIKSKMKR